MHIAHARHRGREEQLRDTAQRIFAPGTHQVHVTFALHPDGDRRVGSRTHQGSDPPQGYTLSKKRYIVFHIYILAASCRTKT